MRFPSHAARVALATLIAVQACIPSVASADHLVAKLKRLVGEAEYSGTPPHTGADSSMEVLAENIDWLEHYIDTYGSVVAKQPDIWGQARLTKHRDEYERVMFGELGGFQQLINAQVTQADSAFFAQAMALSNAAGTTPPPIVAPSSAGSITASTEDIKGVDAIQLEPVIHLDQLSRYIQHLHELRRISEGDDTSDSPGYSLNLVRIPISIMPGKMTRKGFGAEVTITATPVLSEDLMPTTFRNLVINDLVDQLGLPLVRTVEDVELMKRREELEKAQVDLGRFANAVNQWYYTEAEEDKDELKALIDPLLKNPAFRAKVAEVVANILESDDTKYSELRLALQGQLSNDSPEAEIAIQVAEFLKHILRADMVPSSRDMELTLAADSLISAIVAISHQQARSRLYQENAFQLESALADVRSEIESAKTNNRNTLAPDTGLRPAPLDPEFQALVSKEMVAIKEYNLAQNTYSQASQQAQELAYIPNQIMQELNAGLTDISASLEDSLGAAVSAHASGSGRARNARNPLPPSQVVEVYGSNLFLAMADFFCTSYSGRQVRWAGDPKCNSTAKVKEYRVDLLDAQKWLGAEVAAAYELLSQPEHVGLWYQLARADSGLASAIRAGHLQGNVLNCESVGRGASVRRASCEEITPGHAIVEDGFGVLVDPSPEWSVAQFRDYFLAQLHEQHGMHQEKNNTDIVVLDQLAWTIVVESALLNQRLNDDIRKLARAKQAPQLEMGRDFNFFIPDTVLRPNLGIDDLRLEFEESSTVFQEYVRVRWPIHVFALDPREQDQNVADASARRRELQFAMSLAFVTGQVGANSLTQFARTLETEVQTIALNRTAAAFSHGRDTFGWRFQPRVQALEAPGTLGALKQTVCGINPDADLVSRELEPGMREAVAVVIMPSFVPYVDFDVRTNWYKLDNPKNAALTMKDTMRLSRAVTAMRNSRAQCAQYQHLYRDGELRRLFVRVDQLDRELPLQTLVAQAPYENTLGGFEMFNTGVTDLAPELIGWYGAPGIVINDDVSKNYSCGCSQCCQKGGLTSLTNTGDKTNPLPICEGQGTTVFLVGDNFSVHDTKLIAGGVCIPHVQLVSREIMRVVIPSCVNKVEVDGKEYVAVYAATPYGVTNHLHIPVQARSLAAETKTQIAAAVASEVKTQLAGVNVGPPDLSLRFDNPAQNKLVLEVFCPDGDPGELRLKAVDVPKVNYTVAIPGVDLNAYEFSASIYRKSYLFPLVTVKSDLSNQGQISADDITTFLNIAIPEQCSPLQGLAAALSYTDLSDDGKDTASLVVFVRPKCGGCSTELPTRVGEIPIEIRLACPCCEESARAVAPTALGPPSALPSSASGCNCTTAADPASSGYPPNPATATSAVPSASDVAPLQPSASTDAPPQTLGISSSAAIRAFHIPTPPAVLSAPAATPEAIPAGTPLADGVVDSEPGPLPPINIHLQFPVAEPHKKHEVPHFLQGPVVNEYKARATECWRNARDQVPGPFVR